MKTKTLQQTVTLKASPRQVYDNADGFGEASVVVGSARENQPQGRRKIHCLGSHISGFNLALKPGRKIVQAWRATGWRRDHYSVAIYDIAKTRGGTKLKFTQIGIPPQPLQWPLPRMDRDLLDADERNIRDRNDKPTDQRQSQNRSRTAHKDGTLPSINIQPSITLAPSG
jgi:Activator of Hsp90 ATPase homolog 1-like protein